MSVIVQIVVIGILCSLTASGIAWCFGVHYARCKQRKKYGKLTGTFKGFAFTKDNGRKLSDVPQSHAEIRYEQDNLLSIVLTHDERTWKGIITMETGDCGTVVWRYTDLPEGESEFGFKRCIFNRDEVYLVGEKLDGYQKEVLRKSKD